MLSTGIHLLGAIKVGRGDGIMCSSGSVRVMSAWSGGWAVSPVGRLFHCWPLGTMTAGLRTDERAKLPVVPGLKLEGANASPITNDKGYLHLQTGSKGHMLLGWFDPQNVFYFVWLISKGETVLFELSAHFCIESGKTTGSSGNTPTVQRMRRST